MKKLKLNAEWTALMDSYRDDHQNETNQLCHTIGIPMIAASFPVGATVVGLPTALHEPGLVWGAAKAHVVLARRRAEGRR